MSERFDVRGKTAIVTGGARGIGLGCSQALAKRGARVVVVDLDQEACDAAAAEVSPDSFGLAADVTDLGAMQEVVAKVAKECGGVDIVIANAGIAQTGATVRAMPRELGDRVLAVNLNGVYNTALAALPEIASPSRAHRGHRLGVRLRERDGPGSVRDGEGRGRAARPRAPSRARAHGAGASVAYFGFIDTDDGPADARRRSLRRQGEGPGAEDAPEAADARAQAGETVVTRHRDAQAADHHPRRWAAYSTLRGVINPLIDSWMVKNAETQDLVRDLDSRADEEQITSA